MGEQSAEKATLPLDEQMYAALLDAGFDEGEAETALGAVLPLLVADLWTAAAEVEWRFRSMTFSCGSRESTTRLHPSGQALRDRYAPLALSNIEEPSRG